MQSQRKELRTIAPDGRPEEEQPEWRKAFPIDIPKDNELTRRNFMRFLGLTSLAFAFGQCWIVLQSLLRRNRGPVPRKAIARLSQIAVGQSLPFNYPDESDGCTLIRLADNGNGEPVLLAYNRKCPHLSCAVVPEVQSDTLLCPCHQGSFDLRTGRPIAGPPRRPLTRIHLEREGDIIYAVDVELRMA